MVAPTSAWRFCGIVYDIVANQRHNRICVDHAIHNRIDSIPNRHHTWRRVESSDQHQQQRRADERDYKMKNLLAAAAALLAVMGVATAADLGGSKDGVGAYSDVRAFTWTGAYIGGRVGGSHASHDLRANEAVPATCHLEGGYQDDTRNYSGSADVHGVSQADCENGVFENFANQFGGHANHIAAHTAATVIDSLGDTSLVGGLTGGYRAQMGSLVVGVKAAYDFGGSEADLSIGGEHGLKIKEGPSTSLLAEFGYANGRTLFHGDVGYGWTKAKYVGFEDGDIKKRTGHVIVGGGVSYAFTDRVFADLSYEHWISDKETIASGEGFAMTDEKSVDRVMLTVGLKLQ